MHDDQPTLIMVKRAIAGPEIITPGMGYKKARKAMLHAEGLDAGAPCPSSGPAEHPAPAQMDKPSGDHSADMKEIAEELYKASEMHKGQADRLMGYVKDNPHNDSDSYGKKKDL
jgi:hypothetical protein|tara:strand:+ start:256 stop:597 length:342 start_codon:yes stop_codon:yes gene_type:complete